MHERERRQPSCDEGRYGQHRDQATEAPDRAALEGLLAGAPLPLGRFLRLPLREAGVEERSLLLREREFRLLRPRLERGEARAAGQEARVSPRSFPLGRGARDLAVDAHVLPRRVDPALEPAPGGEQGLVRHLHGGLAGRRVAVEGEQAVAAEGLDHGLHGLPEPLEREHLGPPDPPPRVLTALPERDEAQEELPGGRPARVVEAPVEVLRPLYQRPRDPADRAVGVERHLVVAAPLEQLGQRVLEERQRPGLVGHLADDLRHELGADGHALALGRPGHGALQFLRGEGRDDLGPAPDQGRDLPVPEGAVEEIRSQREHHAKAARRFAHGRGEGPEERPAASLVPAEREDLLELVHEQQCLRPIREEAVQGPRQTALVPLQLLEEPVGGSQRDPLERRRQLLEGIGARQHLRDEPSFGAREGAGAQLRDEAGPNDRRLAAPRRSDDREEPGVREEGEERVAEGLPPEEVGRVGLEEGAEALVGVADLGGRGPSGIGGRGLAERLRERDRVGEPVGGVLGGGGRDDLVHGRREPGGRERGQRLGEVQAGQLVGVFRVERPPPTERLVQHDAEAVDVRAGGRRLSSDLLGREVAGRGRRRGGAGLGVPGHAEVREVRTVLVVEEDVRRLHVAVDHPLGVRGAERAGHLRGHGDEPIGGKGATAERVGEAAAAQPAHHEVGAVRLPPVVVEGDDVGVLEAGDQLRLGLEAADEVGIVGELGPDDLDGHLAADLRLGRPVDDSEAPPADLLQQSVAAQTPPLGLRGQLLAQDPLMQIAEFRRGVDPQLRRQHPPGPLIGIEGLSLPPRAV